MAKPPIFFSRERANLNIVLKFEVQFFFFKSKNNKTETLEAEKFDTVRFEHNTLRICKIIVRKEALKNEPRIKL